MIGAAVKKSEFMKFYVLSHFVSLRSFLEKPQMQRALESTVLLEK